MNSFIGKLLKSEMARKFYESPTPRSIAYISDLLIVVVCSGLVFLLPSVWAQYDTQVPAYLTIVGCYAIMDLILGCYRGMVRFSLTGTSFRTFKYVSYTTILLIIISAVYSMVSNQGRWLISPLSIAIIGAIIMCVLLMVRVLVKYVFIMMSTSFRKREPVLILGSAINSLSLATSMAREADGNYEPKALLTLNTSTKYSNVNGMPIEIFEFETVKHIFDKYESRTLIILHEHKDRIRGEVAECLITNGIRIMMLNQIEEIDLNADNKVNISGHVRNVKIEDLLGRPEIKIDSNLIHRQINGATVLITGAAGSIGSEIVRQVSSFKAGRIILLDQAETPMHDMQLEMKEKYPEINIVLAVCDVQNKRRLRYIFEQYHPQFIYHAAAYKHVPMMENNAPEAVLTNVMGTQNLADLAVEYGVQKFVMISTDKAVNPTNIMGASKRVAEIYVQSLYYHCINHSLGNTQFITTRFGNVLGSNGSVIPLFRSQIEKGGPVTVTHRDIIRYFMTIPEACMLVLEAGCIGNGGEIYIFDMGKPMKIYDLATRMIVLAGLRPGQDIQIVETGLRPGEKLYEELLNDKETTLPSKVNDKIMIAKVRRYEYEDILPAINEMIEHADASNIYKMVRSMKMLVPEFISKNSVFESIDRELQKPSEN